MKRFGIRRKAKFDLVKVNGDDMYGKSAYGIDKYEISAQTDSSKQISAGWTIYDPVKRDFVFKPRCEASIREWIHRHNPLSYWLAICIANESDKPIMSFEVEFETSSLIEVREVFVDGFDVPVHKERGSKLGFFKWVIPVSEELGVSIPRGGSKRVYANIHSKVCGQKYTIENGVVRTENMEFRLNDLDFEYSCDITNVREEKGLVNNPGGRTLIESAVSYQLERKELRGDNVVKEVAKYLLEMFRLIKVGERRAMCYVEILLRLEELIGDSKLYKRLHDRISAIFARKVEKNLDELRRLPDEEIILNNDVLRDIGDALIDCLVHF